MDRDQQKKQLQQQLYDINKQLADIQKQEEQERNERWKARQKYLGQHAHQLFDFVPRCEKDPCEERYCLYHTVLEAKTYGYWPSDLDVKVEFTQFRG